MKTTLGSIGVIASGSTPPRAAGAANYSQDGTPWVKTGDLNNSLVTDTHEHITPYAISRGTRIFPAGTVMVAMYGGFRQIGRTGLLAMPAAVNQAISAIQLDRARADPEFVLHVLNHSVRLWRTFAASSRRDPNITRADVAAFPLTLPPLAEQRRIAAILRAWDDAIEKLSHAHELGEGRYVASVNRLAGARQDGSPLLEGTRELTARNADLRLDRSRVMGVSNKHGIVPMRAQSIAADLSRYQVLPPRAFAYNPMRIDVGSIAMSRLDVEVIVSPDYVLFECDERRLLPEYLHHVIETTRWGHDVSAGASGSVRTRTYYDELAAIRIHLPSLSEQRRIADLLDAMRDELVLLDREIELLRTQKRGLMQKLLTGEIRVPAEEVSDD